MNPELLGSLALGLRIRRHAALAGDAFAKRDVQQVAGVVVGPVVVDAREALGLAARLHADQRAAVRAAVLEGMDPAGGVARHDHRHLAEEGGDEALRLRDLGPRAEKAPRGGGKKTLL